LLERDERMQKYAIQFILVREIQVETDDEAEAEKIAFARLSAWEQEHTIAHVVLDEPDDTGAYNADAAIAWKFATEACKPTDYRALSQ
jgi:hypothetical protein